MPITMERVDPNNFVAYAQEGIVDEAGNHVVVYVTRNVAGYAETTYTGDLEYCKRTADAINETLGYSPEHVMEVVASSLRAGRVK